MYQSHRHLLLLVLQMLDWRLRWGGWGGRLTVVLLKCFGLTNAWKREG